MPATEQECDSLVKKLQTAFKGKVIAFDVVEAEEFMIFVLCSEGPVDLRKQLPTGWEHSDWFNAEHRGVRCTIVKRP